MGLVSVVVTQCMSSHSFEQRVVFCLFLGSLTKRIAARACVKTGNHATFNVTAYADIEVQQINCCSGS